MTHSEHKFRKARRKTAKERSTKHERDSNERPTKRKKMKHEASKEEQAMVGQQVVESMTWYTDARLEKELTQQQLEDLKPTKLNKIGVMQKDNARIEALYQKSKLKLAKRKNPDKTIEDIEVEGDDLIIDNDTDWKTFEEQEELARRKEVSTLTFWQKQSIDTLIDVYESVFPGIIPAVPGKRGDKPTKKSIMDTIRVYLAPDGGAEKIDISATVGLSTEDSEPVKRIQARDNFFKLCSSEINPEYLKYSY